MKSTLIQPIIYDDLAEFYSLWRDACLGKKTSETEEIRFLLNVLASSSNIHTIIDLGGSIGLHAIALADHGFDITLLDKSTTALNIAKRTNSRIKTIQSDFESITLDENFDASLCMLSSANCLLTEEGRESFYSWVKTHVNDLAIFDQTNFLRLPKNHSDNCQAEDKHFRFNVLREWHFENDFLHTSYVYEFIDKASDATKIINDSQTQKFLKPEELIKYMGKDWRIIALLGDCNLQEPFDEQNSPRMIAIFKKNH
jgi:hypothetical protein